MTRITRIIAKGLAWITNLLPQAPLEMALNRMIAKRSQQLAPDEALRFLFRLDAELYALQGPLAGQYGGGLHTKHKHTGYHDFFVARIKASERVLDIGCGIGAVAADIAQRTGATVHGVDLNADSIAEAQRRYNLPNLSFAVQDALQLEAEAAYDTILLNVLEHIVERSGFLRRAMQVTKAKRIFIRVPLFERDWRVPLKRSWVWNGALTLTTRLNSRWISLPKRQRQRDLRRCTRKCTGEKCGQNCTSDPVG